MRHKYYFDFFQLITAIIAKKAKFKSLNYLVKGVFLIVTISMNMHAVAQSDNDRFHSRVVSVDLNDYAQQLSTAPKQNTTKAVLAPLEFDIPMPDGTTASFYAVESSIMDTDFANAYPTFKTYAVKGIKRRELSGRISITPYGFNAVILAPEGFIHIRPLDLKNPILHQVELVNLAEDIIECHTIESVKKTISQDHRKALMASNGITKKTYSLAIVGTGEFHNDNGGSVAAATAVAMNSVNGIQAIFEIELSVAFNLLTPFIYTDAATDPFNLGLDRTKEAGQAVEANFSGQGYDIGHVFHGDDTNAGLGGGGVAGLGVVCNNSPNGTGFWKAGGWSGSFDNTSAGWIKLVTHEFGHMFDMPHTFNGDGSNCTTGNHPRNTAYEIGSGTSIMSYRGICAAQYNIPSGGLADHYFHANSLDRALTYINTQTCHTATATGNVPPVITIDACNNGPYSIPVGTPFRLTGAGTDADGDQIYYSWEQYDEDGQADAQGNGGDPTHGFIGAQAAASAIAPLFRSYPPTISPSRTFPSIDLIRVNQYASSFEPLPTVARTLNFRLTGRDRKPGGGGIDYKSLAVTVNTSGPLSVTAPNGGVNLTAGNTTTVNWSNNTNALSATVNIRLSIDGGSTYPYTLASATPNDGSQTVTIPAGVANTTSARIMVESAGNTCVVFFDISDADFAITSNCQAATSNICPTTAVNLAAGNAGLNLTMNQYFGAGVTALNYNITGGNPSGPLANATTYGGLTCQTIWPVTENYAEIDFVVSASGAYTLSFSASEQVFVALSVFVANGYNSAQPCNSTFLGSSATGAISGGYTTSVTLNACTTYKAVLWTTNNRDVAGTVTFTGVGDVYGAEAGPGNGYSYTYAAVNTANNQVSAVSTNANFMTLAGGNYQVFGASYYSDAGPTLTNVNPATWIGQTTTQILSGGSCVLFSTNSRLVNVTGSGGGDCPQALAVDDTPIASGTHQAGTQLTSMGRIDGGSNVLFRSGNNVELRPNFKIAPTANLEVNIGGCQ